MFRSKVAFVIGAGASKEVGLPTGSELIPIICKKLDFKHEFDGTQTGGDRALFGVLRHNAYHVSQDVNLYGAAGRRIANGLPLANSVDDFMDMHRDDDYVQVCGKLAIVQTILEQEQKSTLYYDAQETYRPNLERLTETWFVQFMRILREDVPKAKASELFNNVSFIVFNYDRCLEHFLFHAVQLAYALDAAETYKLCNSTRICHPYGFVGSYCETQDARSPSDVPFGAKNVDLIASLNAMKTYTEQIDNPERMKAIRQTLREAEVLVFLGFSFHPQNMRLLEMGGRGGVRQVYATAKGISASDVEVIRGMIKAMIGEQPTSLHDNNIRVVDKSCNELFVEYRRSLMS